MLTDVIVIGFFVKILVYPKLLNLEKLLTAGVLLPERSPQDGLQLRRLKAETHEDQTKSSTFGIIS